MQRVAFSIILVLSIAPIIFVGVVAWNGLHATDAEISASAPEDLIGLGFWFSWIPVAVVQSILFFLLTALSRTLAQRRVTLIVLVTFLLVSGVSYWAYLQLYARVIG